MGETMVAARFVARPQRMETTRQTAAGSDVAKRVVDVVGALVLLLLTLPVLLVIALAVRVTSGPGVLFRQHRVGFEGRRFAMFKFRTMVHDAEDLLIDLTDANEADGPLFKLRQDPRVTTVGRVLRRTSLDELPQLWNVLWGDMSLVGPRPALPHEVAVFPPEAWVRHTVRPGITGLWQISGRSDTTFDEYLRCDLEYVERRSLLLDVAILTRTVPAVVRSKGSY
jgi:exopolysaccharide biosynthesis polyprenyl glycosylphosphotransferase